MMRLLDGILVGNLLIVGGLGALPRRDASVGRSVAEASIACLVLLAAVRYLTFVWG